MKYLNRHKVYEKVEPFKNAKKLYVFCEGELGGAEIGYFNYFKGFSSNIDIIPIPNNKGKSDPLKLKENAELVFDGIKDENNEFQVKPKYVLSDELEDEVWFVIDTDRWNEGDKISKLKTFVVERNKVYQGWFVAQSNPSFELWLYYHFHNQKPTQEDVNRFKSFKEFVNSKIEGGFDPRKMPLEIQKAASIAEQNFEILNGQPSLYSTEVFSLAKQIISFTKSQLDQCLDELKNA